MNSYNCIGNLTREPELRYTPKGTAVANFGIAINRKRGGEDRTVFLDCVAWGQTAELVTNHLHKGDKAGFTGELDTEKWSDKDTGRERSKIVVVIDRITFCGSRETKPMPPPKMEPTQEETEDDIPF